MDMKKWLQEMLESPTKKAMPILSFPSASLLGMSVAELLSTAENQAAGIAAVAQHTNAAAAVSMMDLSIEAEAFGSTIKASDHEVPTIVGHIVETEEDADALVIPAVGAARTGRGVEAVKLACEKITDRPVFAGVIGPFSLAARLIDVTEVMVDCYDEPDMVHTVLDKVSTFLINYINAYKEAGANGVVMAEPLAGMLSPGLAEEFSHPYVKRIVDAVQTDDFAVIYHNCGDNVKLMVDGIYGIGAMGYHFGNACRLADMLPSAPADVLVMGNVDPAGQISQGTPESVREATRKVMEECVHAPNFVISSGCDIPPMSPWGNIEAFFEAVNEFYGK
jgi:uroporphyrinogen decarboxylase